MELVHQLTLVECCRWTQSDRCQIGPTAEIWTPGIVRHFLSHNPQVRVGGCYCICHPTCHSRGQSQFQFRDRHCHRPTCCPSVHQQKWKE